MFAETLKKVPELVAVFEAENKMGDIPTGSIMLDGVVMSGDFARMFFPRTAFSPYQMLPRTALALRAAAEKGESITFFDSEFTQSPEEWAATVKKLMLDPSVPKVEIDSCAMLVEKNHER